MNIRTAYRSLVDPVNLSHDGRSRGAGDSHMMMMMIRTKQQIKEELPLLGIFDSLKKGHFGA